MKIGIAGCTGRMGIALVRAVMETDGVTLGAGSVRADKPVPSEHFWLANGVKDPSIHVATSSEALVAASAAVIDFSSPELTLQLAAIAAKKGIPLVSGTTGLSVAQMGQLKEAAKQIPVLWASNMSVGVALLNQLVKQAATALGEEYNIEIVEMHHRHKVDAPSGTALTLGRFAAEGRGLDFDTAARLSREGNTGARNGGEIGFATLRGGDVIGDHTVIFAGPGERIELSHKSSSRDIYARGAVRAAQWLRNQKPGFYSMQDMVNHEK